MYIVLGLGNPGREYEKTRHNVGFMAIDTLSEKLNIKVNKIKYKGLYGEGRIGEEKVILLKPQTFMNNSGESLREAINFYKVPIENVIVIVDDIDIKPYQLRIKKGGSAGTHNGLKSIINLVDKNDFIRVKIGVGKKHPNEDLAKFVLSRFPNKEEKNLEKVIDASADAVIEIIERGIDSAMNNYNNNIY